MIAHGDASSWAELCRTHLLALAAPLWLFPYATARRSVSCAEGDFARQRPRLAALGSPYTSEPRSRRRASPASR